MAVTAALQHANVDVKPVPVPLLGATTEPRARMIGYLDGCLDVGTPRRHTAARLLQGFPGTLAELLLVVRSVHQPAAN
jgi:hypothetical protein